MGILKNKILLIIVLGGFILRMMLTPLPGFRIDVDAWFAWAQRLNQLGFANFYSDQIWTNYTPGFLYILGLLGWIKNSLQINNSLFYLMLKLPSILAEVALAVFVYQWFINKSKAWAKIALMAILFNPAFIFNSAVWGQIDGLFSLVLVLSIYFLMQKGFILSSIFLALGFLIKPQAIFLLPAFGLYLFKNFSLKNFLQLSLPLIFTTFLVSLPFFLNQPFTGLINLIYRMLGDYPFISLYAYNFWGIWGFWINDSNLWNGLTLKTWGYLLYIFYWIIIIFLYFKRKISILVLVTLAALSFFFLPTRVHERYLYPAIPFLILVAALLKSHLIWILAMILSLIHFLNLYYVYVYYNEFYLKMPKLLYNSTLYNLLDTQGRSLSFLSTTIFVLISLVIIKLKHEHSKT